MNRASRKAFFCFSWMHHIMEISSWWTTRKQTSAPMQNTLYAITTSKELTNNPQISQRNDHLNSLHSNNPIPLELWTHVPALIFPYTTNRRICRNVSILEPTPNLRVSSFLAAALCFSVTQRKILLLRSLRSSIWGYVSYDEKSSSLKSAWEFKYEWFNFVSLVSFVAARHAHFLSPTVTGACAIGSH